MRGLGGALPEYRLSRQPGQWAGLAGRITVIRGGEIIADLPTAELLSRFAGDQFGVRAVGPRSGLAGKLPAGPRAEADADTARVVLQDAGQARLHHFFLDDLHASGIPLLSVTQAQPDLEEIFLRLIGSETGASGDARREGAEAERAGVTP